MTQAPPPMKHEILDGITRIIYNVDHHARDLNNRWGFNRLPYIVPIELTQRFVSQKRKWEMACFTCTGSLLPADLEHVRKHGDAMLRAYAKLEEVALAEGHSPTPPGVWEFETNEGKPIVLVRTRAEVGQIKRDPPAQVWCLEEIGEIITRFPELVLAKQLFPQAEVIQLRTDRKVRELIDDELSDFPF